MHVLPPPIPEGVVDTRLGFRSGSALSDAGHPDRQDKQSRPKNNARANNCSTDTGHLLGLADLQTSAVLKRGDAATEIIQIYPGE